MASTSNNGWPTPDDTAFVYQGANAMRSLGNAIDSSVGAGLNAWIAWTPTISGGFTVGNGTFSNSLYCKIGKTIHYYTVFTYGSTSSANTMTITLPVQARVAASQVHSGFTTAGGGSFPLLVRMNSTTTVSVQAMGSAAAYVNATNLSTTIPGTFATGNIIAISGTFEQA